jgi:hypothetical protein
MKFALLSLLGFAAIHAHGATAYDALGVVSKQRGEKTMDRVTEVRGINGASQPKEWVVVVSDKEARGGVREFGVQGTKLASERTPTGRAVGAPMNMNQLNLDSDGAHTIAEREAKKAGFEYDYADYTLHAGTRGGAPVWELRLIDDKSGATATITIAADNGTLLNAEGLTKSGRGAPPPVEASRPVAGPNEERPSGGSPSPGLQRTGDKLNNFFERVGRHMERRGHQIGDTFHNLFTGDNRHTAGPHSGAEAPPPPPKNGPPPPPAPEKPRTYRDPNGTDYRPRD